MSMQCNLFIIFKYKIKGTFNTIEKCGCQKKIYKIVKLSKICFLTKLTKFG